MSKTREEKQAMNEVLAAAFDDLGAAADVLHKLRSLESEHLVELERLHRAVG